MQSPDQSQSIDEAAARLGVSPATIRRRIKTGEIHAYKHTTAYGFEWRIPAGKQSEALITSPDQEVHSPDQDVITPTHPAGESPELMKALEMVDNLTSRNEQLAGQVGFLQAKLQDAQEEVQQLRLLTAPKEDEPVSTTVEQAPAKPKHPQRRSWWQRLTKR